MKHTLRTILALCLTVITAFCMSGSVFAASVTIKDGAHEAATYEAYQVMKATEVKGNNNTKLYTYTVNDSFKGFFENGANGYVLDADNVIYKGSVAEANKVGPDENYANTNKTDAAALASALEKYAKEHNIKGQEITANTKADLTAGDGFYVVRETASKENSAVASKPFLLDTQGKDITVTAKDDSIPLTKKEQKDGNEGDWVDTNDVNIGDTINYKVNSKIPEYEANVNKDSLKYTLTDTFSAGLTYNKDVKVTVGGKDITAQVTVKNNDNGFTVDFPKDVIYDHQGEDVRLTYSGILNDKAVVNSTAGNVNTVELEYTNNPNKENDYDTKKDETKTYTYEFQIHKVDKNDITEDLAGAKFVIKDSEGKVIANVTYDENGKPNVDEDGLAVTDENGMITVKGLDEGTYLIEEEVAPEGYSLLGGDVTVIIKGKTDNDGNKTGEADITAKGPGVMDGKIDKATFNEGVSITTTNEDGVTTINAIVTLGDAKGISLPETGSKNAMRLMIGGGAVILLGLLYYGISRRREREAE